MRSMLRTAAAAFALLFLPMVPRPAAAGEPPIFGALQSDPARAAKSAAAGIHLATLSVRWERYEPRDGVFDSAYVAETRQRLAAFRAAGQAVLLDFGFQYPPSWIFDLPHSRFVDQYGEAFLSPASGDNGVNAVFNAAVREKQADYVRRVFADLGTDFFAVRLGWGKYGELCYPLHRYGERRNCYWAFDDIAQGKAPGLPEGLPPCPVPGWKPGSPGPGHRDAAKFADWYLDGLKDYQNWQVQTVRRFYPGRLAILYPSWGIRPGQLEAAIAGDLGGATSAERNGEVQRGYDFARLVESISDPNVIVYCTWVDTDLSDDTGEDRSRWSPVHFLAALAAAHHPALPICGENTGRNDVAAMRRCFDRVRLYHMLGLVWAFEPDLYSPRGNDATLADYERLIGITAP